jgi:hypothetical protein
MPKLYVSTPEKVFVPFIGIDWTKTDFGAKVETQ